MSEFNEPPQPAQGDGELGDDALGLAGRDSAHEATHRAPDADKITVTPVGKRKLLKEKKQRSLARRITYWVVGVVVLALLAYGGFYGYIFYKVENNIRHSNALGTKAAGKGYDLLLMGLDTRLDENGKSLAPDVYDALHAGTADDGGNNSNVLMYIHVSSDGSKAVSMSIPRDDWVDIANCTTDASLRKYVPSGCKGKIKSAYGWAFANAQDQWVAAHPGQKCGDACYQQAKDIARKEEVQTVEQFLFGKTGGQITSFVEVTMGAFYQIAQQIGKVQVCVKEATQDSYSGADFKPGLQWVNAAQAVAFVRQRRDIHDRYNFTDLDRSRRQQAFIVSLLTQMKSAGTLLNPVTLNNIVDVASRNIVLSNGVDPLGVAKLASNLSGGNLHFYTLPIVKTTDVHAGSTTESVNIVDVNEIRAVVANLLNPPAPTASPSGSSSATALPSGAGYTVNAVNYSGKNAYAGTTLDQLKTFGYTAGTATTGSKLAQGTTITYNPADKSAADSLAKRIGGAVAMTADATAASHVLRLDIGTALAATGIGSTTSASGSPTALPSIVDATGGGTDGPSTNALSDLSGSGIPCVK